MFCGFERYPPITGEMALWIMKYKIITKLQLVVILIAIPYLPMETDKNMKLELRAIFEASL